jgi:hypothetical protein
MGRDGNTERHRDEKKSHKRHREDDRRSRSSRHSRDDVTNTDETDLQRNDTRGQAIEKEPRHDSKRRHRDVNDEDGSDDGSYKKDRNRKSSKSRHRRSREERDKKKQSNKKKKHHRRDDISDDSNDRRSRKKKNSRSDHSNDDKIDRKSLENQVISIPPKLQVDKNKLFPLGDPLGRVPDNILDVDKDYFEFHQHFWLYLYRNKQIAFNDLTTEQARSLFADFVNQYNNGALESGYYDVNGPPHQALNEIKTSRHKWGFQISDRESKNLQTLQGGIRKQTEYTNPSEATRTNTARLDIKSKPLVDENKEDGTHLGTDTGHTSKAYNKRFSKQERKEHIDNIDDIMGKKDGRERLIEKRKEVGAKIHGSAKDREEMTFAPVISDDVLYGDTNSDFQLALASQKQKRMKQDEHKQARIAELQAKEQEKQKAMLQMLGLSDKIKTGDKIQIQPRND